MEYVESLTEDQIELWMFLADKVRMQNAELVGIYVGQTVAKMFR